MNNTYDFVVVKVTYSHDESPNAMIHDYILKIKQFYCVDFKFLWSNPEA